MGNDKTKIEKLGIEGRVMELKISGVYSARAVGKALRSEGYKISDSAVNRYFNKKKDTLRKECERHQKGRHIEAEFRRLLFFWLDEDQLAIADQDIKTLVNLHKIVDLVRKLVVPFNELMSVTAPSRANGLGASNHTCCCSRSFCPLTDKEPDPERQEQNPL